MSFRFFGRAKNDDSSQFNDANARNMQQHPHYTEKYHQSQPGVTWAASSSQIGDARNPASVSIEMKQAPPTGVPDIEHANQYDQHNEPTAPPLQQETSWNSHHLAEAGNRSARQSESGHGNVGWMISNGQPLGQPAPPQNVRSSWRYYLVPNTQEVHYAFWTLIFTCLAFTIFFYMAAQYPLYITSLPPKYNPTTNNIGWQEDLKAQSQWGPESLGRWVRFWGPGNTEAYVFDANYALAWGARYNPKLADGQWWRWFTSIGVHASMSHVLSNMVMFVFLSFTLEQQYGSLRILLVFLMSGLGGNFTSAVFEDGCRVVVGASGAVFGFLGLYCADILLHCQHVSRPLLRFFLMLCCIILVLVMDYLKAGPFQVSHFTHIGGFVCGLFPSMLFLPSSRDTRWKQAHNLFTSALRASHILPPPNHPQGHTLSRAARCIYHPVTWYTLLGIGAAVLVLVFVGMPVYLYTSALENLTCPPIMG